MMRASVLGLVVLLSGLVACGDENRTPTHFTPSSDKNATSGNDTTIKPAPAVPGGLLPPMKSVPPQDTAVLTLAAVDTSTLRGSAQLAAFGRMTSVSVTIAQGHVGTTYEGAIRQGSCGRMGPTVTSLNPVSADSLGTGAVATDVSVPIDSLLGSRHVVVYGKGGRPQMCGAVGSPATPPRDTARSTITEPAGNELLAASCELLAAGVRVSHRCPSPASS